MHDIPRTRCDQMKILRNYLEAATKAETKVNATLQLICASTTKILHAQGYGSPLAAANVANDGSTKSNTVFLLSHAEKPLQIYEGATPDWKSGSCFG